MEEKRMVIIGVGTVLVIMTVSLLAVTLSSDDEMGGGDGGGGLQENKTYPLLLISLDGFRFDYMLRGATTLESLAKNGVKANWMMPCYPTKTFPNHYSIVTGLYPESHGIVNNDFHDPDLNVNFSMSYPGGEVWGGEPIWNTLTLQNKTSHIYFWPGSDRNISGLYPTEYYPYDGDVPFTDRVDKVLEWLSLPADERPDFIGLYFNEPDSTGHEFGPDDFHVDAKVMEMDGLMLRLMRGLEARELENKVNIIVLSDHGMAKSGSDLYLNLTTYVTNFDDLVSHAYYGAFTAMHLHNPSEAESVAEKLSCPGNTTSMRAFLPKDLPKRFHYSNNKRIGDIVLDLDSGYVTYDNPEYIKNPFLGQHGYDNHINTMRSFFIASGPDFKKDTVIEPFHSIELYNLMCYLIGVEPSPNNGTEGALYDALLNPPPVPDLPEEAHPPAATFPTAKLKNETLQMASCPGDGAEEELDIMDWLQKLDIPEDERKQLEKDHLPWGIPLSGNLSNILLLHHKDHVTAYSEELKMPLWTSFTVTQWHSGTVDIALWSSDVRLNANNTPSCEAYDNIDVDGKNVYKFPLFFPSFSTEDSAPEIPFLVSNAVPLVTSSGFEETVTLLADTWRQGIAPLNIMIGIAFDMNADSFPDDLDNATFPEIPSHFYIVVTRCNEGVTSLDNCNSLDAQAFIIPQLQSVTNDCLTGMQRASFHLSTVHDVELLTGFTFFPNLEPETRLQLALRIHTYIWRNAK